MNIYSIFDDFDKNAITTIESAGGSITIHPFGIARPNHQQLKNILECYDCIIIGTGQKITKDMFKNISSPRIIATASVGIDHIQIPNEKKDLVTIINTPTANAQSVAEFTFGCALMAAKRLYEGNSLYHQGKDNKSLCKKPEDLKGKVFGVVGAGNVSLKIIEFAHFFGLKVICWTRNPSRHKDLEAKDVKFVSLSELCELSDIISVNLPNNKQTENIISENLVSKMKDSAVFISVSRLQTVNYKALLKKASLCPCFYVCLDVDLDSSLQTILPNQANILITPHIAGGTIETRKRMFLELAQELSEIISQQENK